MTSLQRLQLLLILGEFLKTVSAEELMNHTLTEVGTNENGLKKRRSCVICYRKMYMFYKNSRIAKNKGKLTLYYCALCPKEPAYCVQCFQETHFSTVKTQEI